MIYSWAYVFEHTRINKLYVGSTKNLLKRIRTHRYYDKSRRLSTITGKYGIGTVIATYPCNTREEAALLESYLWQCIKKSIIPESCDLTGTELLLSEARINPTPYFSHMKKE